MPQLESALLLSDLLADESRKPQLKASLNRIKEACDALDKRRAPIEVSTVAAQLEIMPGVTRGPAEGSIRNQRDTLLAYVYLRRAEQKIAPAKEATARGFRITDKKLAEYVRLLEAKVTRAENDRNRIAAFVKNLSPIEFERLLQLELKAGSQGPMRGDKSAAFKQSDALSKAAANLLETNTWQVLRLELAEIEGVLALRTKIQHHVILWEKELLALAAIAGIAEADIRARISPS